MSCLKGESHGHKSQLSSLWTIKVGRTNAIHKTSYTYKIQRMVKDIKHEGILVMDKPYLKSIYWMMLKKKKKKVRPYNNMFNSK